MIQPNQQQYLQLDNKVAGRACFLATNLINVLVHTLVLYEVYHNIGAKIWVLYVLLGYLVTYYTLGVVSAIDQNQSLHKFYKISCIIISVAHSIIALICLGCVIYLGTKPSYGSVADSLLFLLYLAILICTVIEVIIDYSNYKYINQLIASSSSQYFLGYSQPAQFAQPPIHQVAQPQQPQAQFSQPYVIHYPQLQQQIPQQNNIDLKQQQFAQPITADVLNASYTTHKQPLILQNGFTQFQ
ncbi:transmembrane protein, putative (macronuclear) [Tetrahymena thermophila SB210]|uniref:Transmembrane protein, putative n=1 Tax=Tetrahymena thermophila (strain SB210) TaxID=312017 RepID=Q236R0_TETTS|nr:transmembrane protein, putative [Tetrahymena thermophila SB210]EAR92440.1 transmembrane protein, putative [Tetrahymena thermophila SB210]|eukprot:XP_001012685.1 transmembrane protein, putative [Tetrahymena thermophila SB210]